MGISDISDRIMPINERPDQFISREAKQISREDFLGHYLKNNPEPQDVCLLCWVFTRKYTFQYLDKKVPFAKTSNVYVAYNLEDSINLDETRHKRNLKRRYYMLNISSMGGAGTIYNLRKYTEKFGRAKGLKDWSSMSRTEYGGHRLTA